MEKNTNPGLIVLLLYLIFYWLVYLNELTLSVCVAMIM